MSAHSSNLRRSTRCEEELGEERIASGLRTISLRMLSVYYLKIK